jgi:phosphoserine phosphatase RsbU/P
MASPRPPLILIVEDDLASRFLIDAVLVRAGFRTARAEDVAGARSAIAAMPPDLILLDVGLPDGSGFDVCRHIQDTPGATRTPIIFLSAHEDVSTKVKAFEAGGVDYVTKPVAGPEIIARVSTHLRLRQASEQLAELQAERIRQLAGAQQALMPHPRDLPEARFHVSLTQVLEAGGDFYDVIQAGNGIVDYLVADASGHDLAASFWTAALKAVVAQYANPANSPRDILYAMNGTLRRILPDGVFFTLVYARLNRRSNRLSVINAAHPPAIVIPSDGSEPQVMRLDGDVIGAFPDVTFDSTELSLRAGDRFVLYSDGLIELSGSSSDGLNSLVTACAVNRTLPLEPMIDAIIGKTLDGHRPSDDIVLMGVEV